MILYVISFRFRKLYFIEFSGRSPNIIPAMYIRLSLFWVIGEVKEGDVGALLLIYNL
jgi:hypothetical protein